MPVADVDAIVRELNSLLDQQLAFLDGDLRHLDRATWLAYDRRYGQIRSLCELLDGKSETLTTQHVLESATSA